uniref:Uncharacterized protein n=1 Tax=Lepeophtheirus salmonis TaxID=72036 RepID=A0A0K2UGB8_LEPSM
MMSSIVRGRFIGTSMNCCDLSMKIVTYLETLVKRIYNINMVRHIYQLLIAF